MTYSRLRRLSLGAQLTGANILLTALLVGAFATVVSLAFARTVDTESTQDLEMQTDVLTHMISASARDLKERAGALAQAYQSSLHGELELGAGTVDIKGRATPVLALRGKPVNLDFSVVDDFSAATGSVATLFVRSGDDFVRVTTSVKNDQGERAVGTLLDREHPGYKAVSSGQRFVGAATLFGRNYMTQYDPVMDASGRVVAIRFVGLDFTKLMGEIKQTIRRMKIGQTGYFFVLDAKPGKTLGTALVHPAKEGQVLLDTQDASGAPVVRQMLERQSGLLTYGWINKELKESQPRDKIVAFRTVADLNWLICGGSYVDEFTAGARQVRNIVLLMAAALLVLIAALSYVAIRRLVSRPLRQVQQAAEAIAGGDLTVRLHSERGDEVGRLIGAINQVGVNLTTLVESVRRNSENLAVASSEIAQGNQDLSTRTESQAAALEQTSSAMQQLGATVQENASFAQDADRRARQASQVAQRSGEVMGQVALTMKDISASSRRIADITAIIDGLAFQTNILALNAAVESARAGEAGRGFAVVATEVRILAARSADAAKEIKSLIAASVERVEAGSTLVDQAGQTMAELGDSIRQVTEVMASISQASQEQATGVGEVGTAVAQMDQSTQQNSALVEEMAAAASSLRGQAQTLVQAVSMFKLLGSEADAR